MRPINALFVDDDATVHTIANCMLPRAGIKVLTAFNSIEADAILHREKVDVILLDVLMPKEDGLAYSERLNKEGNKVPVMILSALGDSETVSRGIRAGAAEYIVKPIDLQDLKLRILKLLGITANTPQPAAAPKKSGLLSKLWR